MILRDGNVVKYAFDIKTNDELSIVVPATQEFSGLQWEFVDLLYTRDSNASPIDLILVAQLAGDTKEFVIRKVENFSGFNFYFQLNKEFTDDWIVKFYTVGALGAGYEHRAAVFWR